MHRPVPISITKIITLAGLVFLALLPPLVVAQEATKPGLVLERGTGILDAWQPDQRLYVKGDVGVDRARLAQLEGWLAANGPHWTVLLMDHAQGEIYRDDRGHNLSGASAVEFAVGRGL